MQVGPRSVPNKRPVRLSGFVGRGVLGENDWFVLILVLCRASTSMCDVVARREVFRESYKWLCSIDIDVADGVN